MDSVKCWQMNSVMKTMSIPSCLLCHTAKSLTRHPWAETSAASEGKKAFWDKRCLGHRFDQRCWAAPPLCSGVGTLSLAKDKGRRGQFLSPCSKACHAVSSSQLWAKLVPSVSLSSVVWVVIAEVFGYVTGSSENPDYRKWSSSKINHFYMMRSPLSVHFCAHKASFHLHFQRWIN